MGKECRINIAVHPVYISAKSTEKKCILSCTAVKQILCRKTTVRFSTEVRVVIQDNWQSGLLGSGCSSANNFLGDPVP